MRRFIVGLGIACWLLAWSAIGAANPFGGISYGVALTNSGYVIGELSGNSSPDCFLWRNGQMTALPLEEALAVNERGQVVGYAPDIRGVLWEAGTTIDLNPPGDTRLLLPEAINNRGQVAGLLYDDAKPFDLAAFLWDNGVVTELGPCQAGYGGGFGNPNSYLHINERGDVIGAITDPFDVFPHPLGPGESFFWRSGVRTHLDFLAGDLNNRGQVVGGSFLWEDGVYTDLGSLGGGRTLAQAINERGQVAGTSETATGERHVFLWEHGRMQDLGGLSTNNVYFINVRDMNERGQVVGDQLGNSMLYEAGAEPFVLGLLASSSGVPFSRHERINDAGQILFNEAVSSCTGVLWTRGEKTMIVPPPPPPPAPATIDLDATTTRSAGAPGSGAASPALELAGSNPSSGRTVLRLALPRPSLVRLDVFDARGRRVRNLLDGSAEAGSRTLEWDGSDDAGNHVAPGIYFTRMTAGHESRTLKLVRVNP